MRIYTILLITGFLFGAAASAEELIVPPLLEGDEMELFMERGKLELPWGQSETMGFNGDYLGPTIRVRDGDAFSIAIKNNLGEESTVHWHGLHVPARFDGGPHQIIEEDMVWTPRFTIDQRAATLWYHPHMMGKTSEHVYNGLAGMFYIEDDYSDSLDIPSRYGENDFPLILQDRRIRADGSFVYNPTMADFMHGYAGNTVLTNGSVNPRLTLPSGTVRFRVLNGSNSSIFRIRFSDKREFTVIASDGGFLPESVKADSLILSPGERFEILLDLEKGASPALITDIYGADSHQSLTLETTDREDRFYPHPEKLSYEPVTFNREDRRRTFLMETRGMGGFSINGKQMSMDRIDFTLPRDSTEVWTIENAGMGMMQVPHSFHVHDVQFSILKINGNEPGPLYRGPKDTILLMPGESMEIALRFEDYTGIYMYHCHFLEHEDLGMMGQFEITPR